MWVSTEEARHGVIGMLFWMPYLNHVEIKTFLMLRNTHLTANARVEVYVDVNQAMALISKVSARETVVQLKLD